MVPEIMTAEESTDARAPVADGGRVPVPVDEGAPPLVPDLT